MNKLKNTKKGMLILSILLLFLVIGAASAADDKISEDDLSAPTDSVDEVVSADNDEKVSTAETIENVLGSVDTSNNITKNNEKEVLTTDDENSILQSSDNENILQAESGSFRDLNTLIKTSVGTLVLNNNYKYDSSSDSAYIDGIDISKSLTIDGNGFAIDGSGVARIFKLNSKVTLKNLNIINAYTTSYGVIEVRAEECQFINVNFENISKNTQKDFLYSSAITIFSNNVSIIGSSFKNIDGRYSSGVSNSEYYMASCILIAGRNVNVVDSIFEHCKGGTSAIFVNTGSDNATIKNCQFNDCTNNSRRGAAISGYASYTVVDSCNFTNCYVAIDDTGTDGIFKNLTVTGCSNDVSIVISANAINSKIYNSTFIKCKRIAVLLADSEINNCTIIGSSFNGVVVLSGVNSQLYNTKFIDCTGGDIVQCSGSYVKIENCSFINNTHNANCVIYITGNKVSFNNLTVINTTRKYLFSGNTATTTKIGNINMDTHTIINSVTDCSQFDSFTPITDLWVSEDGTGDGSENNPANWTYAIQIIDAGGTIHLKQGTYDSITSTSISYNVVGEGKVIINKARFVFNAAFIQVKNIIFNNTEDTVVLYGSSTLINCTFTNFQHSTYNIISISYKKNSLLKNINFINCNFNRILTGNSAIEYLNIEDLYFEKCTVNSALFQIREGGSFNIKNINFKDSNVYAIMNPEASQMLRYFYFDGLTMIHCNITSHLWASENNVNCGYNVFSNFYIRDCNYNGSNSFMVFRDENVVSNITIINLNSTGASSILFYLEDKTTNLNNVTLNNINYNLGIIFNVVSACILKDIDASVINSKSCFSIPALMELSNLTFKKANFTDKIGIMVDNSKLLNSKFEEFQGNLLITGNKIYVENTFFINGKIADNGGAINLISGDDFFIDSCTFINNSAVNGGAVYINNVTNSSYILNSIFINNTASNLGGAVFIEPGIYYYISQSTLKTFNITFMFNDLFDNNTLVYMEDVWVQHGASGNGTYDNPTNLDNAFTKVSPFGNIHFRKNGDIFDYSSNLLEKIVPKMNLTFFGNNTIIKGFSLVFNDYATGVSMYNITFMDYANNNVIKWSGNDGFIVNCTFRNNGGFDVSNGAALYILGDYLKIVNSSFINNVAGMDDSMGGAIYCNGSGLIVDSCNFEYNTVYNAGAHIYLTEDANDLIIINSNFTDGKSIDVTHYGAGVFILSHNFIISDSIFINNCAKYGGALYLCGAGNIKDSNFYNNSATNGSAIYISSNKVNLVNLYFASPKYNENNNLIEGYVYSTQNVNLNNLTLSFTDLNKVVSDANSNLSLQYNYKYFEDYDSAFVGGVDIGETLIINGNEFTLDGSGQARIFNIPASNVHLSDITFVNAHPSGDGGAIKLSGSNANIIDCVFKNCIAEHASGIIITGANSFINNCTFTNNFADCYDGVILYNSGASGFVLSDCIFKDNNASRWAGALRITSDGTINNCIFENNSIVPSSKTVSGAGDAYGSAIYIVDSDGVIINNCIFKDNHAGNLTKRIGGAIYATKVFTLTNSSFINNSASRGSAIYYNNNADVDLIIDSCVFVAGKFDEENNKLAGYIYSNRNIIFNNVTLSFTDLSYLINNTDNIDLQFNYLYFNNYDQAFITGVPINKETVINGNDKVIDGNFTARIFNISSTVVLNNLNLINGNASLGGAIYSTGDLTLTNVTFANNTAVNGSAVYIIKTTNHWSNITFKDNNASNATVYFDGDSTLYSNNLSFINNQVPKLNIVGTNHIYSPIIYVSNNHIGFGIITDEATSLTYAVDNILPNGMIIILDDYDVESIIKFTNLCNITVVGNKTKLKDKYLFILPIIQKYIKKKQIVF